MDDKIKFWIESSLYDYEVAQSLLENKHYIYVAFMCHQSIEKMLKAIYAQKFQELPPKIHNLPKLAELTDIVDDLSEE